MIAQVPELADGGFWYVLPTVEGDDGVTRPAGVGSDWCAWDYGIEASGHTVVRTAEVVTAASDGTPTLSPKDVFQGRRPVARIGGR